MGSGINQEAIGEANVLDINKPPVKDIGYQEFPKTVYNHEKSRPSSISLKQLPNGTEEETHIPPKIVSRIVQNKKELDAALRAGWKTEAPQQHLPEIEESDEEVAG